MRTAILILVASAMLAQSPAPPKPTNIGTMSQLMIDVIYPTSNDIFYIFREPPKNDVEWNKIRTSALTLAESANLLMAPERARDEKWIADAALLQIVGKKAYQAAIAKDEKAIEDLNQELNDACVACHMDYRPIFQRGKGKQGAKGKQ